MSDDLHPATPVFGDQGAMYTDLADLGRWLVGAAIDQTMDAVHLLDTFEAQLHQICDASRILPNLVSAKDVARDRRAGQSSTEPTKNLVVNGGGHPDGCLSDSRCSNALLRMNGVTFIEAGRASECDRWMIVESLRLATMHGVPVTYLSTRAETSDLVDVMIDAGRSLDLGAVPASAATGSHCEAFLAALESAPLEICGEKRLTLSDIRALVRRRLRRIVGHHVVMLDMAADARLSDSSIDGEILVSGLRSLSREGCQIIVAVP